MLWRPCKGLNKRINKLIEIASEWIKEHKPEEIISGVALGWDTALALAAIENKIPLTCAIPFKGQESRWTKESKDIYFQILNDAEKIIHICGEGYSARKMQIRNEWMVDNAHIVLAMWDGTTGGTYNCITYAEKKRKRIINLYNRFENNLQDDIDYLNHLQDELDYLNQMDSDFYHSNTD